jgi:hypothetical protein
MYTSAVSVQKYNPTMPTLPPLICPGCGGAVQSAYFTPKTTGGAPQATGYPSCLRRCENCGFGFSNAATSDPTKLTIVYRDPFVGIPSSVADGHASALVGAMNVLNRRAKRAKFVSLNSEDHVTWTIFRHLQAEGQLRAALARLGVPFVGHLSAEPTLLLWGVPVPNTPAGAAVQARLVEVLDALNENHDRRSEPDVILDCGAAGVVFTEIKLRSRNDSKPHYGGWDKYLNATDAFTDGGQAKGSALYELARNWRIAWDLAGHRPMALINLGPPELFIGNCAAPLSTFAGSLSRSPTRLFLTTTWQSLLGRLPDHPEWLQRYAAARRLPIK